jgi:hypothetical protein
VVTIAVDSAEGGCVQKAIDGLEDAALHGSTPAEDGTK